MFVSVHDSLELSDRNYLSSCPSRNDSLLPVTMCNCNIWYQISTTSVISQPFTVTVAILLLGLNDANSSAQYCD